MQFSQKEILPRIGRMEQLASIRRYVMDDGKGRGMRALECSNASGLDFTVYPDRGLDIGPTRFNGLPVSWSARNGAVAPAFYNAADFEWLRSWGGGLLTTCGWLNVGGPQNNQTFREGLHGRADNLPAEEVNTRAYWDGPEYKMEISGKIIHSRVFGEHLVTTRTIATCLGRAGITLRDSTQNLGDASLPFMQLYHMNFGWPLISETATLSACEHAVAARDPEAQKALADWAHMPPPQSNFAEQVLYHDIPTDDDGFSAMRILNPAFFANPNGPQQLRLTFRKTELPYLIQWRQAGTGDYVMGLEPANCYPIGQDAFAQTGLLRTIEPGQTIETVIRVDLV